jgi:hypothetical protein
MVKSSCYVLVQHEGAYSEQDWKVLGVFANIQDAMLKGWLSLVEEALRPWKLKFYKNRDAEFASAVGISKYHIEEWVLGADVHSEVWYLGWKQTNRAYKHDADALIKSSEVKNKNCEAVLRDWYNQLKNEGIIPAELSELVQTDESDKN